MLHHVKALSFATMFVVCMLSATGVKAQGLVEACVVQFELAENATVQCSKDVPFDDQAICSGVTGPECLSTLVEEGFSANGVTNPSDIREFMDVPPVWLPSPGVVALDEKVVFPQHPSRAVSGGGRIVEASDVGGHVASDPFGLECRAGPHHVGGAVRFEQNICQYLSEILGEDQSLTVGVTGGEITIEGEFASENGEHGALGDPGFGGK